MCVDARIGKGWAKGLTAATDPRVARAAAAHRGLTYARRTPRADCKWTNASTTTMPLEWSENMAYIVGLTATDGCLITGRRKINFKSGDRELVETYLRLLGRTNRIKVQRGRNGGVAYFTEFSDTKLYGWFLDAGLTPRKSLTLGALAVPDAFLFPALRGLFEGDGHIQNFTHKPTARTYPNYEYERLLIGFNSASRTHLEWIRERIVTVTRLVGSIQQLPPKNRRHDMFRLAYGKHASIGLLRLMYPREDVPRLTRKWKIWVDYERRLLRSDCAEGGI